MPTGKCKLCLRVADLQKSHLIPQGIHRALQEPNHVIRNPILVTASTTVETSEQVRDYLLCHKCELRFQQYGEDWVMKNGPRRNGRFPLREALVRSTNRSAIAAGEVYKEPFDAAFDLEKLIYFAASVFWRSSAHHWRGFEHLMTPAKLPDRLEEELRLYLLHEGQFPGDLVLLISVTATRPWPHLNHPSPMVRPTATVPEMAGYAFMIPGMQFRLHYENIPDKLKHVSVALPPHAILLTDKVETEIRTGAELLRKTSRVVGGLAEKL